MRRFEKVIKKIATANHTTKQEVLLEMQMAIDAGFNNLDPDIQLHWKSIPCKGDRPTVEEVMNYTITQVMIAKKAS